MTLLQFILILSGFIFLIFAIDAYSRKKLNFLHFIVFFGGIGIIVVFSLNIALLDKFGRFFGIARGADLLVYISIISLVYFYFEILNKINKDGYNFTRLVSSMAIRDFDISQISIKKYENIKDNVLFHIRAYNEAKVIGSVIDEIINKGFTKILIVNDGSKDDTLEIVKDKIKQYPDKTIIVISNYINRGGGAANKTGFEFLKKYGDKLDIKWIVTYDADGQMSIDDIDGFIREMNTDKYDILLGSRFIKGGSAKNISLPRRIILFGSKIITLIFNKILVSDPHNGYRMISLDAVKNIKVYSDGMTYASELLDEVKRLKLRYKEIPVNIKYTEYSMSKGQKNSNALSILLELIYKKIFFK